MFLRKLEKKRKGDAADEVAVLLCVDERKVKVACRIKCCSGTVDVKKLREFVTSSEKRKDMDRF